MKKYILIFITLLTLSVIYFLYQNVSKTQDSQKKESVNLESKEESKIKEEITNIDYNSKLKQPVPVFKFKQGENVFLSISSDIPDEAHLHGYDLSTRIKLDGRGEIKFIANKTGRFPIELEKKGKEIAIIEIYPN